MALMLRDAALRAAPQHEGNGRSTNLWLYEMRAGAIPLFPGLLFTMDGTTPTCRAQSRGKPQITSSVLSSVSP
jgi:hypothetical protein